MGEERGERREKVEYGIEAAPMVMVVVVMVEWFAHEVGFIFIIFIFIIFNCVNYYFTKSKGKVLKK